MASAGTSATNSANSATASANSATASAASAATAQAVVTNNLVAATRVVKIGTTTNITLSGLQTIDGVTTLANDRVLVKNQTVSSQNGVYTALAGAWTRTTDFNTVPPVQNGAIVSILQGTTQTGQSWVLSCPDNPIVLGTSLLTFTQSTTLNGDITTYAFQQDGAGTVPLPVVQIIKEWNTLQMYGGGPNKTSAQNAAAFVAARNAMLQGGTLIIPPGQYACDPVVFQRTDVFNNSMIIQGVSNPPGVTSQSLIQFTGTGSGTFWSFDSPNTGFGGGNFTVKNLWLQSTDPTYSGSLVSSTTSVTDGSVITSGFRLENCLLSQGGGASASATLLNIGKNIVSTITDCNFAGGATQILGQQGQTVAGTAQARQSTTLTIRKCLFSVCNGVPILYGGEGWGLYDNTFEAAVGGRGRAFQTNANYPVLGMTWINNWFGDVTVSGDQWLIVYGSGFNFMGNVVKGDWPGSGPGSEGINLNSVKGFNITGNTFDNCSTAVSSSSSANNYGVIRANVLNNAGSMTSGSFGANVDITINGTYP